MYCFFFPSFSFPSLSKNNLGRLWSCCQVRLLMHPDSLAPLLKARWGACEWHGPLTLSLKKPPPPLFPGRMERQHCGLVQPAVVWQCGDNLIAVRLPARNEKRKKRKKKARWERRKTPKGELIGWWSSFQWFILSCWILLTLLSVSPASPARGEKKQQH